MLAAVLEVAPRDSRAVEGIGEIDTYLPPTPGYVEQVYFYDLAEGSAGRSLVALRNASGDRAVVLRFNKKELPHFTQWKNTVGPSDGYVTGLEPGTNYPNLKGFEREKGRVVLLQPGESYHCRLELEVCTDRKQVAAIEEEVAQLQGSRRPTIHKRPHGKYSPI